MNIADFWRRWHMSLTRFLREYVYFPLGGSRRGLVIQLRNVLITFLLSGLWHGAGWTFVAWGALHGCYLVIFVFWERFKTRRNWTLDAWHWRFAGAALTFVAVMFTWVFFRSPTVEVAGRTVMSMLGAYGFDFPEMEKWLRGALQVAAPSIVGDKWGYVLLRLALLLGIAWLLPNTQQLLAKCEMVLDGPPRPSRLSLRLGAGTGFALGALFLIFVYSRYNAADSPFLYFNF